MKNNETNSANDTMKLVSRIIVFTLLAVVIVVVVLFIIRIKNWGIRITQQEIDAIEKDPYEYTDDEFFIKTEAEFKDNAPDGVTTVLVLGNNPTGDDFYSENNLATMLGKKTGFDIINCSVAGSCVTSLNGVPDVEDNVWDVYNPYWLLLSMYGGHKFDMYWNLLEQAAVSFGDGGPENKWDILDKVKNTDLKSIDVVLIMYDATDYYLNRTLSVDEGETELTNFAGSFNMTLQFIKLYMPWAQIVVMSAPYGYAIDDNGEYISSDIKKTTDGKPLSQYTAHELHYCYTNFVTYIDNIYGTITEDNAKEYLSDNYHLNQKGRELMLDRLLYAFEKLGYIK